MDVGSGEQLVGRSREQEALKAIAARALSGSGGSAVVAGQVGMGKSALLTDLADSYTGSALAVGQIVGTAAESAWAYSGLHQLFSVVTGALNPIDRSRSAAWADAVATLVTDQRSPYEVALQVQVLVEDVPAPLLIVIDDAHLLDEQSREVLGFVARRLGSMPVSIVLSCDLTVLDATPFAGLRTLHLTDLPEPARVELLSGAADGRIAADVADALAGRVGGNPRALREVVQRIPDEQLTGQTELDLYLPASDLLARMFLPDLDEMDGQQRQALLTAALVQEGPYARVVAALGEDGDRLGSWLAHRFLVVSDGDFRFRSPAVASVIWHASSPESTMAAHRALADVYASIDPDLELRHRAKAQIGHDDTMAATLHDAAHRALARGEVDRSTELVRQSVRLAGTTVDRVNRLILSGQLALYAGRLGDVSRIVRERTRFETSPSQRADLAYLEGYASYLADCHVATGQLSRHADEVEDVDPDRAARLYVLAATQHVDRAETDDAQRLLVQAERHLTHMRASTLAMYRTTRARLAVLVGDADHARALLDAVGDHPADEYDQGYRDVSRAIALQSVERFDEARAVLATITHDRQYGTSPVLLAMAHAVQTGLELRTGRVIAAREAAAAAEHALPGSWGTSAWVSASMIWGHALLGEPEQAWERATHALDHAQLTGQRLLAGVAHAGTGFLLLMAGRLDEAVPVLDRARGYALELPDPALVPTEPDLVEAYVRQGELSRAREVAQAFEIRARSCPSAWAYATLARCRALVAEGDRALSLFAEAVDASGSAISPIEQGRTVMAYGERLRRVGRKLDARRQLERAVVIFRESGAVALAERAERELRTNGVVPLPRVGGVGDAGLTAAESRVAEMAAAGMRNREIASELYVSTRTIEGHLSQVFRKLGIRSRTELAGVLAKEGVSVSLGSRIDSVLGGSA